MAKRAKPRKPESAWLARHHNFQEGRYAEHGKRWSVRRERMLELIPKTGVSRALEIGGGEEPVIKRLNYDVEKFGIDICGQDIDGITTLKKNAEAGLPFPSGHFGLVVMGDLIEHIYDTAGLLSECNRVLHKGGVLVLSTPNLCSTRNVLNIIRGNGMDYVEHCIGGRGHLRYYAPNTLQKHLGQCGFSVEKLTSDRIYLPFYARARPISWLSLKLAGVFPRYGSSLIVRARKM